MQPSVCYITSPSQEACKVKLHPFVLIGNLQLWEIKWSLWALTSWPFHSPLAPFAHDLSAWGMARFWQPRAYSITLEHVTGLFWTWVFMSLKMKDDCLLCNTYSQQKQYFPRKKPKKPKAPRVLKVAVTISIFFLI